MKKSRANKIAYQYFFSYFSVILFAASLIALLLTFMAMREIHNMEIQATCQVFDIMAHDFSMQERYMEESRNRVFFTGVYHPVNLNQSKYKDIELLNHFSQYAASSPLTDKAFLLYPETNNIYRTSGYLSDFNFYFQAEYSVAEEKIPALYETIRQCSQFQIIDLSTFSTNECLLFVYPIRYLASNQYVSVQLVYEIQKGMLSAYLEKAAGEVQFNGYQLYYKDQLILQQGHVDREGEEAFRAANDSEVFTAQINGSLIFGKNCQDGYCHLLASFSPRAFEKVIQNNWQWLTAGLFILIVLFSVISLVIALKNSRPIRKLALQYSINHSDAPKGYNELSQLEAILEYMERRNEDFTRKARDQMLLQLIQGESTEQTLERWDGLGISLPYHYSAVFALSHSGLSDTLRTHMMQEINAYSDEEIKLYGLYLPERDMIAILANFDILGADDEIQSFLETLFSDQDGSGNIAQGGVYDTPLNLPLSFNEALFQLSNTGEKASPDEEDDEKERATANNANISKILAVIEERLGDCNFGLDNLADECGLSLRYASHLIKLSTGLPFKEYLIAQRMQHAIMLLKEHPELSVAEVSQMSGYRTLSNFFRKFRETTGMTPIQYREHASQE